MDELNAETIFAIEKSDCNIAEAIVSNTKDKSQNIAVLDSVQSVTEKHLNLPNYCAIMYRYNYNILKEVYAS